MKNQDKTISQSREWNARFCHVEIAKQTYNDTQNDKGID